MKLIDADALKEDFKARLEKAKNWKENALNNSDDELVIRATATIDFICEVIMTINNAPTVSEITKEKLSIAYDQGYEDGKNNWLQEEKPQGEWIEVKPHQSDLEDGIDYREECSICHEPNRHYGFDEYHDIRFATYYRTNFCPNCGAKMKGGAE